MIKLTDNMELRELNGPNQLDQIVGNGNGVNVGIGLGSQAQQSPIYRNHQQQQQLQQQQQQALRYVKHRELPVDVPDSFVGMAKQSPRYPPTKPNRQTPCWPSSPINQQSQTQIQQQQQSQQMHHHHHQQPQQQLQQQQQQQQQSQQKLEPPTTDLCSVYNRLQRKLNGDFANVSGDAKLAKLLSIYNTIVHTHNKQFKIPALTSNNQENLSYKVSDLLQSIVYLLLETGEAQELLSILSKHEMAGVCSAFDRIVQSFEFTKSTSPNELSDIDIESNLHPHNGPDLSLDGTHIKTLEVAKQPTQTLTGAYNETFELEDSAEELLDGMYTKTLEVEKSSKQALGATIVNGINNTVIIGRILCEGFAQESGLLQKGDEILKVNGILMRGKNIDEVVNLVERMTGTLTFTIVARNNKQTQAGMQEKVYVRAFFKYDSEDDNFIPCKELGLSFDVGDVLVILDQSDKGWWQARREHDGERHLPGLIPSINLLKERERIANNENSHMAEYMKHEKKNLVSLLFNCPKGSSPRRRKLLNMPFPEEIPYYEELAIYYPDQYRKRPIILVGPKMIGQREIVAKLAQDPRKFANPIAHTSRPMQAHERNGVDFHFVTRAQFEADIKAGKFIECGQYQNQYYGTSLDAMMEVVKSKKTCVHLVNTPSIFNFRQGRAGAELKPFFVFVKPDDSHPEKLRNIVASFSQPKSNLDENIRAIIAEVQLIEAHYLPFFDKVITVTDVDQAYRELLEEIEAIEKNPQWIPHFWKTKHTQPG